MRRIRRQVAAILLVILEGALSPAGASPDVLWAVDFLGTVNWYAPDDLNDRLRAVGEDPLTHGLGFTAELCEDPGPGHWAFGRILGFEYWHASVSERDSTLSITARAAGTPASEEVLTLDNFMLFGGGRMRLAGGSWGGELALVPTGGLGVLRMHRDPEHGGGGEYDLDIDTKWRLAYTLGASLEAGRGILFTRLGYLHRKNSPDEGFGGALDLSGVTLGVGLRQRVPRQPSR